MVEGVGQEDTAGKFSTEGGECGVVCDVAGREDEGGGFSMQLGNGGFEADGVLIVAGYVARAASAGAVCVEGFVHRPQNLWVAAHTEVVIRAPGGDKLVGSVEVRLREILGETIDVIEVAVGLVLVFFVEFRAVEALVVEL